jgi:hypothetical protein
MTCGGGPGLSIWGLSAQQGGLPDAPEKWDEAYVASQPGEAPC